MLDKEIESYGLISITEKGREFLANPYTVMLKEEKEYGASDDDDDDSMSAAAAREGSGGGDLILLSMLKDLRKDLSAGLSCSPGSFSPILRWRI